MKTLEELNQQMKFVKTSNDLIKLVQDTIASNYQLIHHDKYASLGCQNLSPECYDISILDEESNKFMVYGFLERVTVRYYKTMYKYFTIIRAESNGTYIATGEPCYSHTRFNIN